MSEKRYRIYSTYLREKYGEKVYKLPVNLPVTCPNRDGNLSRAGCTFCAEVGTGFESFSDGVPVIEQLEQNRAFMAKRFKAKRFIAYFQNFTNTYMDQQTFEAYMEKAIAEDIVEIAISTRPDSITEEQLDYLVALRERTGVAITVELGLQTVNYRTLERINRGHGLAAFVDAALRVKRRGFELCVHLILNLPGDEMIDVEEAAGLMNALSVDSVKLHSLYIARNTVMGRQYEEGQLEIIPFEAYVERVIRFLLLVDPKIVIQRLAGRAPEEDTLFCNWNKSWWRIVEAIDEALEKRDAHQGDLWAKNASTGVMSRFR